MIVDFMVHSRNVENIGLVSLFTLIFLSSDLFILTCQLLVLVAYLTAISWLQYLQLSPVPFAIMAIAASAAFMTPISSTVNTMV